MGRLITVFDFHSLVFGWRVSFLPNEWVMGSRDFFPKAMIQRIDCISLSLCFKIPGLRVWIRDLWNTGYMD